jgi:sporulation protein YlmC with PRC-barrel domain
MAGRGDVSFYKDFLHKPVVDRDGRLVGALLDLAAGSPASAPDGPSVHCLVIRPSRARHTARQGRLGDLLVLPWEEVERLESRSIRLRRPMTDLAPSSLEAGVILLRKHVMDQQVIDRRGFKVQRVNDIAMDLSDGSLHLWGMDTGLRGFLTRLGHRWGLLFLLRPVYRRMPGHIIRWDLVDRLEPARGNIRLRLSLDEVRTAARRPPESTE